MFTDSKCQNAARIAPAIDAHGRAALLLVESLIHELCDKSTLSVRGAVTLLERAVEVQSEFADEAEMANQSMRESEKLLKLILQSLSADDVEDRPPLHTV